MDEKWWYIQTPALAEVWMRARSLSEAGLRPTELLARIARVADKALLLRSTKEGLSVRLAGETVNDRFPEIRGDHAGVKQEVALKELSQTDFVRWLTERAIEVSKGVLLKDRRHFEIRGRQEMVEGVLLPLKGMDGSSETPVLVILGFPDWLKP